MSTVDNLDIQISTNLNKSNKELDKLIKKMNTVSSSLTKIGSSTSKATSGTKTLTASASKSTKTFKGLASSIGKFYATYFMLIRGIKSLWKSIEGTADYIEAFNYFEVSFNKIASEWKQDFAKYGKDIGANTAKEYAESFGKRAKESLSKLSGVQVSVGADGKGLLTETGMKNLGLNIQQITQYASQLASITNSVGQTGEVSLATANSFTKLAGDISSLFNQDYSSVAKNLQSGLIGQSRALYKYGIDITNATLQTYAYELGLEKAVSEMTQAEKMQLRMIAILDQSKVSWGDLANTINSPSNMIRQFKNNLKEAGMMLGQLFIPLLGKVLPVINGVTIAIKRLLGNIAGFLGIKLDLESFGQVGGDFDDLSDSLDDVAESAKKAKAGLRGFDELKTINMPDSSGSASGLGGAIDLTDEILKATEEYEKVWQEAYDKMEQRAERFADAVEKYLAPVKKLFQDIAIGDWFAVGQDVSNIVSGIFDFFSRAIESVNWEKVGTNIGLFLAGIDWTKILTSAFNLHRNLKDALITVVQNSFEEAPMETFLIIAGIILRRLGVAIGMKTLALSLKGIMISGIGKIFLNSWIKSHFSYQVAGMLPGATATNPITLSQLAITISGFLLSPLGVGTPAFDVIADKIQKKIKDSFDIKMPKWVSDFWNDFGIGLSSGALAGSWIGPIGTVGGMIIGGIIGGLEGIEIDGESVFKKLFYPLFNFDYSLDVFKMSGEFFKEMKKAWEEKDWLSVGGNIIKGIGMGLWGALSFLVEPIGDLFLFIWNTICQLFGIKSPATKMKPLGRNILLGIVEGFGDSFDDMKRKIREFFSNLVSWWEQNKPSLSGIKLNVKTPKITVSWDTKSASAQVLQKLGLKGMPDFSVKWFQTGGYLPSSFSLIGAGENGIPEILGNVGGKPAIAGGTEITGIRDEIRETANEEIRLLRQQNALLQSILEKTGITDSEIGKSAQRYARDYFNRTGNEAYSF